MLSGGFVRRALFTSYDGKKRLGSQALLDGPAPDAHLVSVAAELIVRRGGSPQLASLGFPGCTAVNHVAPL